jgi:flagellar protein FliS
MEKARLGFGEEDPRLFNETIHNNLQKAQAILTELNSSLNLRDGGEFSQTMRRLYNYFDERLQTANIHKQSEPLLEVIARVNTLRNAWAEMLHSQNNSTPTDEIRAALVARC